MSRIIVLDVGSTTTKALLFEKLEGRWHYLQRGEAATSVEAPAENVMIGVERAISLLQERSGLVLREEQVHDDRKTWSAAELLATSSAGGGLQMVVCGNTSNISGESARRAALGGGAILLEVFARDDKSQLHQRLERLRALRPDMILLSGGVDDAKAIDFIVELCDFIRIAKPRPKYGYRHKLPIIYAGAASALPIVEDLLTEDFLIKAVDNLRPSFDRENLEPTRAAIQELFIEHVMTHAPGYDRLQAAVSRPLLPTPVAVAEILSRYAFMRGINLLCVDIGGATTDLFSVVEGNFVRTVSANYGMSYSIGNVVANAGINNLLRWLPQRLSEYEIKMRIAAKLLHPVSIPATKTDIQIEHAVAREALRLAYLDHLTIAKTQSPRSLHNLLEHELLQKQKEIEIGQIDLIIGSGGVLSNAPQRGQAAAMLLDAFQPLGVTELMVDSVFMLPHLGAFAHIDESGALQILEQDCLIPLGTALVPLGRATEGRTALSVRGVTSQGQSLKGEVMAGQLVCLPLPALTTAEIEVTATNGVRWPWTAKMQVRGGCCGLILDARGRPLPCGEPSQLLYDSRWVEALEQHDRNG